MPDSQTILAVLVAGLALSVTPGPSMLYVLSRSVAQGRIAGFASAVGLALGAMVLAVATALGLAALFAAAGWIVPVLRLAGAAYLVWLGVDMIRDVEAHSRDRLETQAVRRSPIARIVGQGMLVEMLNPKTVLFFALFLPPFVAMGGVAPEDVRLQFLVLGVLVPLTAIPSDVVVAWMGASAAEALNRNPRLRRALGWAGGLVLIAIAANLLIAVK
jgi:threonine/homoserine/homoserine lactone efflux protein